ncbi:HdeD family acid-resistance protein [Streptomyces tropicalis]|uniref:HdeD family acid-resistance protein n=1 Tax=Streptomyces tropicalis TaxID=3034234 RepID=A0ABT6A1Y3_9ACTN|nr:HdeD family acid-resistance protein [Streptomyces tropicalis]MDF3298645.1 HdeD family acid-resistance protein [Streptomyces tropicalis]
MTVSRDPAPRPGPEHTPGGTATGAAGDPEEMLAGLGGSWSWMLGSALATLVPGVLILVWPDETLHVLAVVIGLYLLVVGAFRFVAAFSRAEHGERLPRLLMAVLFVLAGVLCLRHPMQTVAALSLIVGIVWLVTGMLTAYTAIGAKDLPHRGLVLATAALGVIAGIVVLALPLQSAVALTRLLGLWLVLLGLVEIGVAFALRAALRRDGGGPPPGTHAPA